MNKSIFVIACSAFALTAIAQNNPSGGQNQNQQNPKEQNQFPQDQPSQSPQNTNPNQVNPGENGAINPTHDKQLGQDKNQLGTQGKNVQYCAMQKEGSVKVISGEKEITSDITLSNGTKIKSDGTIIKKDGSQSMLKDGQCVNTQGNIIKSRKLENKDNNRDFDNDEPKDKDRNRDRDIQNNPMNK